MSSYNQEHHVYKGIYKNKVMSIAKSKEIVKNYMEEHRGLSKSEYQLEEDIMTDIELLIENEDYVISEFHGYYIPYIDQLIIESNELEIKYLIENTINSLKQILLLSENVKKIKSLQKK